MKQSSKNVKSNSQSGQTIIAVFFMMLVALVVGVTVSTRFIKGLRTLTRTDDFSKALGVAEAALERVLLLPRETIEDYTANGTCAASCTLAIPDSTGQQLTATVDLSFMGDSSDTYSVPVNENSTEEVILTGYPSGGTIELCWNSPEASVYANYISSSGDVVSSDAYAYAPIGTPHIADGFDVASPAHGFSSCFTINTDDTPEALRVKVYHDNITLNVVPQAGAIIPIQGILLTSTGLAGDTQRRVYVLLTSPKVPELFDYAIYQFSETEPLSNAPN